MNRSEIADLLGIPVEECLFVDPRARNRHTTKQIDQRVRKGNRHTNAPDPDFVGIDGEGGGEDDLRRQNYLLMCASSRDGDYSNELFRDNRPLTTKECLDFILDIPAKYQIASYYFNYDIAMFLRDLPGWVWKRLAMGRGKYPNGDIKNAPVVKHRTFWEGYALIWTPGKHLEVSRAREKVSEDGKFCEPDIEPGSTRTVHEAFGFFQAKFIKAVESWNIGTPEQRAIIAENKDARDQFKVMNDKERSYCHMECWMLAEMMHQLRDAARYCEATILQKTGLSIKMWPNWRPEGAGSMASQMMKSAGAPRRRRFRQTPPKGNRTPPPELPRNPPEFMKLAGQAYYGGRFEIFCVGLIPGPLHEYDVHSAYPSQMLRLPCPLHTSWEKLATRPTDGRHYVADIDFEHPLKVCPGGSAGVDGQRTPWCALPFRTPQGRIYYPIAGRGTYWGCEIDAAETLFGATIKTHSVWGAVKNCDCHPFSWVRAAYEVRAEIGKENKQKGQPIKLGLNSLYGKTAQQVGDAPYHDIISAGLITAMTRARLLEAVALNPDAIVMLATDGIYSTAKLPSLDTSGTLGTWEYQPHGSMFIVQPGVYWFPEDGKTEDDKDKAYKTRGVSKSVIREYQPEFMRRWAEYIGQCHLEAQREQQEWDRFAPGSRLPVAFDYAGNSPKVEVRLNIFVGPKLALAMGDLAWNGRWRHKTCEPGCDHRFCGRRLISFDYRWKRERGIPVDTYIKTFPISGTPQMASTPYNSQLLTGFLYSALQLGSMPDYVEMLEREPHQLPSRELDVEDSLTALLNADFGSYGDDDEIDGDEIE